MSQLLMQMAQRASKNPSLLASLIERQASKEGLSWDEMATQLQITPEQLAKLALCRRPNHTTYTQDIVQLTNYTGIDRATLVQFIHLVSGNQFAKTPSRKSSYQSAEVHHMFNRRSWIFAVALVAIMLVGAFFLAAQPAKADATLIVSDGEVTVSQTEKRLLLLSNQIETAVSPGKIIIVKTGDIVTVGNGATAQLRLFDGSTVDLAEGTTIQITELNTSEETYRVRLHLMAGKTVSRVVRLIGVGDAFDISTPSSTASVRGTVFTVEVLSADATFIACAEGTVYVTMGNDSTEVSAGQALTAVAGNPLDVKPQPENRPDSTAVPPEDEIATPVPTDEADPTNTPEAEENPTDTPEPEEIPSPKDKPGNGPPDQVPGNPPVDTPGNGDPPEGGGDPPGIGNGPPDQVPGNPPADTPGNGDPPEGGGDPPGIGNGLPDQVPGNPPADPPGNGNPPEGGGDPPGNNGGGNNGGGNKGGGKP